MCDRGKQVVSTDTNVSTQVSPAPNGYVKKVITTTTKTTYSDGSWATNTQTKTVTEPASESTCGSKGSGSSGATSKARKDSSSSSSDEQEDASGDFSKFELEALKAHNDYRRRHGAPPMKLSRKICQTSQNWANTIAGWNRMQHSSGSGYGENIYWTSGSVGNGKIPVDAWYSEIKDYRYNNPGFSSSTGHFTQVVWKSSTELGIAKAGGYVVANYGPPGNFQGQFGQNVLPPQH